MLHGPTTELHRIYSICMYFKQFSAECHRIGLTFYQKDTLLQEDFPDCFPKKDVLCRFESFVRRWCSFEKLPFVANTSSVHREP